MKYSVDRIKNGIAVCEDENGNFKNFEVDRMPFKVGEGDIFLFCDGEFKALADETAERKKKMSDLQKSIFTAKNK